MFVAKNLSREEQQHLFCIFVQVVLGCFFGLGFDLFAGYIPKNTPAYP